MSTNLNTNKIAAAVLCAGLIAMFTGKITQFLYDGGPEHPGHHEEGPRGYKVEVSEVAEGGEAALPTGPGDLSALYATADVKAGEDYVSKKCTACHSIDKGGANKVGPHLWGVFNRPVASISDFNYSSAFKTHGAGKKWNFDELNHFLWSPNKYVPGTMMSFAGVTKDQERANIIAYLATGMTDSPVPLPKASAKPEAKADAKAPAPAKK